MKKYTVHLDVDITGMGERNDFLVHVEATSVTKAVKAAKAKIAEEQEIDDETMSTETEILDVFLGHVDSLWDRPDQKPVKNET